MITVAQISQTEVRSLLEMSMLIPLKYETVLKPICTYGIQLWGTASTSNTEILERFQSKA
jgi:hypothetical protein